MLFVSEATIKTHVNWLFAKLGVRDRALRNGLCHQHSAFDHETEAALRS